MKPDIAGARPSVRSSANASELLAWLPGKVTERWPDGERFARALAHGSMSVELYAPVGVDPQTPHDQDELYFPVSGTAELRIGNVTHTAMPGSVFFVPAGMVDAPLVALSR